MLRREDMGAQGLRENGGKMGALEVGERGKI